jgi:hypothetical protein
MPESNDDALIKHRRFIKSVEFKEEEYPHVVLQSLAHDCLDNAENAEKTSNDKQMYWCVGAIVFASLAVEGFINAVFKKHVKGWEFGEPKISATAKGQLIIIENLFNLDSSHRNKNFPDFDELFTLRNDIVHPKPLVRKFDTTEGNYSTIPVSTLNIPTAKWKEKFTLDEAKKLVSSSDKIISKLSVCANVVCNHYTRTKMSLKKKKSKKS